MEKVALVSYHFWYNYGTCYQSYALWKVLDKMGVQAEYLNFGWEYPISDDVYLSHFWKKNVRINPLRLFYVNLRKYIHLLKRKQRILPQIRLDYTLLTNNRKFDKFRKQFIKETPLLKENCLANIENSYSLFLVGSDQVWNPDCCEIKYFRNFLLDFVKDNSKKGSYASSIGRSVVSKEITNEYKKYLSSFSYISCREKSGCDILCSCLKKSVTQVLDPTLLIKAEDWRKIEVVPRTGQFVLCYLLGNRSTIVEFAKRIADKKGLPLVLVTIESDIIEKYHRFVTNGIGPLELLGLIDKCDTCITDSFHGTAFCINYNKTFYSFMKKEGGCEIADNSRITDTLSFFKLDDRFVFDADSYNYNSSVDFTFANQILERERLSSLTYLEKIINSIKQS